MKRLLSLFLIAMLAGCQDEINDKNPPIDHPYFPSSIVQKNNTLFVFGSNFDLRYEHANVMSVDLSVVNANLNVNNPVLGAAAVTSSGFIPSFPDAPILTPEGDALLYLSRAERSLRRIPLSPSGTQLACGATTALGQDCFSAAPALALEQMNPYYLGTFSSGGNLSGGYVAYLLDPGILEADKFGDFTFPIFYELDRFTWNTGTATAQIDERFGIGNKLAPVGTSLRRTNARVGGLVEANGYLYFLVEEPTGVAGGLLTMSLKLARVLLSDLQTKTPGTLTINQYDFTAIGDKISLPTLAIRQVSGSLQFFVSNANGGQLFEFTMPLGQQLDTNNNLNLSLKGNPVTVCNRPTDMKVSPDTNQTKLVIACDSGKILVYDPDTLAPLAVDPSSGPVFGRTPIKLHFDTNTTTFPFRFYTANFDDGSLSVFDLNDGSTPNQAIVDRKGLIFQPSPPSRRGGTQ